MTIRETLICKHSTWGCRKTADCRTKDDQNTEITSKAMRDWIDAGRPGQCGHYILTALSATTS